MYTLRIITYAYTDGETVGSEEIPCPDENSAILTLAERIAAGIRISHIEASYGVLTVGYYNHPTD